MDENERIKKESYFQIRQVSDHFYDDYKLSLYLKKCLPTEKDSRILDIGCGLGLMLSKLQESGYTSLMGVDISNESIEVCKRKGLEVVQIVNITEFFIAEQSKFDFVVMSHVLEHLEKKEVIPTLVHIRRNILKATGRILIMVPNAQSLSGNYWAYEDFTHNTLFTAGSMVYVLKAAGFKFINFIDSDGLEGSRGLKKLIKVALLRWFKFNETIKFKITGATYHIPSPKIYTWELKVLASCGYQ